MIQSLENFITMAIQGTQVPTYTKHTLFLYFSDFSIFFYMKNKINKTKKQPNKIMLNKANHKTRLTQRIKQNTQEMQTNNKKIERKVIESLGAFFLPRSGRTFSLIKPLNRR